MGHKSRQKDRAHLTATEWREEYGGYKKAGKVPFRRLPFHCCAVTFTPFDDAVCTADGTVFDIVNIVPYIQQYGKHPVSGEPLQLRDLIQLHFHKNADGEYHCPVLHKVFTEHTHIVAVKPTGNVYSYQALDELCIKPKNWSDLLDSTPFTRKDIIHIQDPLNLSGKTITEYDHVRRGLSIEQAEAEPEAVNVAAASDDMKRTLALLGTSDAAAAFAAGGGGKRMQAQRAVAEASAAARKAADADKAAKRQQQDVKTATTGATTTSAAAAGGGDPRLRAPERSSVLPSFKPGAATWDTDDPAQAAHVSRAVKKVVARSGGGTAADFDPNAGRPVPPPFCTTYKRSVHTTGAVSRALTSTTATRALKNEQLETLVEVVPSGKGYMRLHTSLGDLNLELHCDLAPRAAENFMALAEAGYYDNTPFHRAIKNFMIQGGDPTGTGRGGQSVYGPTFKDELDSRLQHSGRGVLSMANSGPNTNASQFFILFKSAHHLDYKHTVFGRVVGGMEVLTKMERVPTDEEDRPLQEVSITGATIFVNPYKEYLQQQQQQEQMRKEADASDAGNANTGAWYTDPGANALHAVGAGAGGVGKYLADVGVPARGGALVPAAQQEQLPKKRKAGAFGNFDAW